MYEMKMRVHSQVPIIFCAFVNVIGQKNNPSKAYLFKLII